MGFGKRAAAAAAALTLVGGLASAAQAGEVFAGVYAHDVTFIGDVVGLAPPDAKAARTSIWATGRGGSRRSA